MNYSRRSKAVEYLKRRYLELCKRHPTLRNKIPEKKYVGTNLKHTLKYTSWEDKP